jgi:DNA-binding response OmpR family regulator
MTPGHAQANGSANTQILIVEDQADTAEMLRLILEDEGYSVSQAGNANIAFGMLQRRSRSTTETPDLVLLDLMMPGMDPLDMVRKVGKQDMPPVIVLSAKPEAQVAQAAHSIEAAAIVLKPFGIEDLLETVRRVLTVSAPQAPLH